MRKRSQQQGFIVVFASTITFAESLWLGPPECGTTNHLAVVYISGRWSGSPTSDWCGEDCELRTPVVILSCGVSQRELVKTQTSFFIWRITRKVIYENRSMPFVTTAVPERSLLILFFLYFVALAASMVSCLFILHCEVHGVNVWTLYRCTTTAHIFACVAFIYFSEGVFSAGVCGSKKALHATHASASQRMQ